MDYLAIVTSASTNNAFPDNGVTAPKHVGADFQCFTVHFSI